ncbi:unnamed protein product [marine sediment metagenome]|uniref:Uncharacterized protein n=1 Tax=marine sediment metagenome TaxID=412755 RepID=X0V666_9ZZZZ
MSRLARPASDDQRAQMRGCLFSACVIAKDMTPVYLCDKRRKGVAKEQVCVLHDGPKCRHYETFPERFDT